MARWTRRRVLIGGGVAAAGIAALAGLRWGLPRWVRPRGPRNLSPDARAFIDSCLEGLEPARMIDGHVHVFGLGAGDTGCWVNPELTDPWHVVRNFKFDLYRAAIGMDRDASADGDYVRRLLSWHRDAIPGARLLILAFDQRVDEAGREHPGRSAFYTPNDYVLSLAEAHAEFVACASIHPYRADAVDRLDEAAARGARAVKWLPNSMGIDPDSPLCDGFYRRLAELGLPLLTHGGVELAVDAAGDQELGNPLRLRRALDRGVRVIVAHCASFGSAEDLDRPDGERRQQEAFDLFMRLFTDPQYEANLLADISALTMLNRSARILKEILRAEELHPRLVNGSDYPLPALRLLYSPRLLEWTGFLDAEARRACDEIGKVNPLLFDFVLKRSLRFHESGRVYRLPRRVFETSWLFDPDSGGGSPGA